jgi:hypothetical protein
MEKDTAGNQIYEPVYCNCCRIDTAGNHEWDCPNRISAEQLRNKELREYQRNFNPLNHI